MVKMTKSKPKINKLTSWVTVRLTDDEFEKISELSEATGLSKSSIFRLTIFDEALRAEWVDKLDQFTTAKSPVANKADTKEVENLITAVNRVGVNVNQLAHQANKDKRVPLRTKQVLLDTINELDKVLEALGCRT